MRQSIILCLLLLISCNNKSYPSKEKAFISTEIDQDFLLKKPPFKSELIEAYVPFIGEAVKSNDEIHFSYELNIANSYNLGFNLSKIEIFNPANGLEPIAVFDTAYFAENLQRPGLANDQDPIIFLGGQYGIVGIDLQIKDPSPQQIYHRLTFEIPREGAPAKEFILEKALINFPQVTKRSLSPPFNKGHWFYMTNSHKNERMLTEGQASYPQRFATDWVYINEDGSFAKGDLGKNDAYTSYTQEILAVANGTVVSILDSIPDNQMDADELAVTIDRQTITGNHIALDIGNNVYAVYAHLIPGSIKVKLGDTVQAGEVIGLLGNSGNSTGPHLHFHLETKSKILLGGEGLPYTFEEYQLIQTYDPDVDLDSLFTGYNIELSKEQMIKNNEMPLGIGVVRFE